MNTPYTIRTATDADKRRIYELARESIALDKKLNDPLLVPIGVMEEFVDKLVDKGMMLVVENSNHQMKMIGEVHYYHTHDEHEAQEGPLQEFSFFSGNDDSGFEPETELVDWLIAEIQSKHRDVFRVKLNAPVRHSSSIDFFKKIGMRIEGNFNCRLKQKKQEARLLLPLSWTTPS
ncbi:MAG: hypothetical protein RG741_05530 [Bacteroidales bacterium]|nr:hypothetical protein [Bacteroidales bacterium]